MSDSIENKRGAGILYIANGSVLLLMRGAAGDFPGTWALPAGHVEEGESDEGAAVREVAEETGHTLEGERTVHMRRVKDGVDFTTFLQKGDEFPVLLNEESAGYQWHDLTKPLPEPMHPGARVAIERLTMNELDIAKAMRDGELVSPQQYQNIWLYALRITGTGFAYRQFIDEEKNEYCYRNPDNYLTGEFLERCNGLPVVWLHPKGNHLTSSSFRKTIIGTCFLPYIEGDEVWAIAKIYHQPGAKMMAENQLSTSPGVMVGGRKGIVDGDKPLLIEGNPSLVDHVAVCPIGVWDKGDDPAGISSDIIGATTMADEKTAAEETKNDAAEAATEETKKDAAGDDFAKRFDSFCAKMDARMDAMEAGMADSKKDSAKKDAADEKDEETKEEAKKDSAELVTLRAELAALSAKMPAVLTDEDFANLHESQGRADSVYQLFGKSAPRPLNGETNAAYQRRLVSGVKSHSDKFKDVDMAAIADSTLFSVVAETVYADATAAAMRPDTSRGPGLRMISTPDEAGRVVKTFLGSPSDTWRRFKMPTRRARFYGNSSERNVGVN